MRKLIVSGLVIVFGVSATRASLAQWTFENSLPDSDGSYAAENGTFAGVSSASAFHTSSKTAYSHPAGAGSDSSYSANHWSVNDYFQFTTSTLGYEDVQVNFDAVSSGTGPKNFNLAYSTDGTSFIMFEGYSLSGDSSSWKSSMSSASTTNYASSFDLASVAELNNQNKIYLRLIDNSTNAADGGKVGWSGTSRVDDFTVSGTIMPSGVKTTSVPEPSTFFAGTLLMLPLMWSEICRRRHQVQARKLVVNGRNIR